MAENQDDEFARMHGRVSYKRYSAVYYVSIILSYTVVCFNITKMLLVLFYDSNKTDCIGNACEWDEGSLLSLRHASRKRITGRRWYGNIVQHLFPTRAAVMHGGTLLRKEINCSCVQRAMQQEVDETIYN